MAIEILSPRYKSEWHQHSCVYCRKIRYEPNDCCKKTKIDIHKFPCLSCLSDYRRRFGALSDDLLDAYLSVQQREMVKHVAPDAISDDLDRRDDERRKTESHRVAERNLSESETQSQSALSAAEQKKEYARVLSEAEVINYEEVRDQIEEMKKKEGDF